MNLRSLFVMISLLAACASQDRKQVNAPCANNTDCADNVCHAGICASSSPLTNGETCTGRGQCRSFNCVAGRCEPGIRPAGADCLHDEECSGLVCSAGGCAAPRDAGSDLRARDRGAADRGPVSVRDFVMSKLTIPDVDPQKYALKIGGKSYNALGAILVALSSVIGDAQAAADRSVNTGSLILLTRVQAASFIDDPFATGQSWIGAKAVCCAKPDDAAACATEALSTCFKGDFPFQVDASSPTDSLLTGKIVAGHATMSAVRLRIPFPLWGMGALQLDLKAAQLSGKIGASTITGGVLAGALSKEEVDTKLIPSLAAMMDAQVKDPTVPQSRKDQILNLFDANKDYTVTTQEVAGNALVKTFLSGDVDVDNDAKLDLSVGIGFEAVGATIQK